MGEVRVRNIDEDVIHLLRGQARLHGKSLNSEIRDMLYDAARKPRKELLERLRALQDAIYAESGELPDSTPMIREERERLG